MYIGAAYRNINWLIIWLILSCRLICYHNLHVVCLACQLLAKLDLQERKLKGYQIVREEGRECGMGKIGRGRGGGGCTVIYILCVCVCEILWLWILLSGHSLYFPYTCTKVYFEHRKFSLGCFSASLKQPVMLVGRLQGWIHELWMEIKNAHAQSVQKNNSMLSSA